jgi:hypothetical protein
VSLFGTTREEKWRAVLGEELYDFVNVTQKTIPPFSRAKFVFDLDHYLYARALYHIAPIVISNENYQYVIAFRRSYLKTDKDRTLFKTADDKQIVELR